MANQKIFIIFAAACTWRKFPDPCALGAHTPVTDVTGEGEIEGGQRPPSRFILPAG